MPSSSMRMPLNQSQSRKRNLKKVSTCSVSTIVIYGTDSVNVRHIFGKFN